MHRTIPLCAGWAPRGDRECHRLLPLAAAFLHPRGHPDVGGGAESETTPGRSFCLPSSYAGVLAGQPAPVPVNETPDPITDDTADDGDRGFVTWQGPRRGNAAVAERRDTEFAVGHRFP